MTGNGSRESPVRELAFPIAKTVIGLDLNRDLGENDEGKYWSASQRNNHGASRMSLF